MAMELPQRMTFEIVETEPGDKGPDGLLVLQARHAEQRRAHAGAAAYPGRHARGDHDRDGSYVERAKDERLHSFGDVRGRAQASPSLFFVVLSNFRRQQRSASG